MCAFSILYILSWRERIRFKTLFDIKAIGMMCEFIFKKKKKKKKKT